MKLKTEMRKLVTKARKASQEASIISSETKNKILKKVARDLRTKKKKIQIENKKDLKYASDKGLSSAMIDRLKLTDGRIEDMASSVEDVIKLKDPIGNIMDSWKRPNGLRIEKVSVPLGVILIIYESRPNVTSECASLCLKSGNAVILRGGKEAFYSNQIIASIYQNALKAYGILPDAVSFVKTTEREVIDWLIQMDEAINLVIPRGGEALIRRVVEKSQVPVIKHYKGICHVYVDRDCDLKMAEKIVLNAKVQRPGVCNAMETLLVHQSIASKLLPRIGENLKQSQCEIRGDDQCRKWISGIKKVHKTDWDTEYLDLILSIKVVRDLNEAVEHIQKHGTGHTEAIVTKNKKTAQDFVRRVDASSVMVNASTRFADGNQYGFGAEIGISTDKIHARGPMALDGLTSYKYVVRGQGQIRQ